MKVTQEKLPASQIGLEVEIEPDVSKRAYEKTLKEYTQKANIPGFRRGKVPRQVLIQRFGAARIKATVLEKLVNDALEKAITQEKIEVLGNLKLRSSFEELVSQFKPGEAITISASVDVPPDVTLADYTGLTVQAEEITFDAGKVDSMLEGYRNRTATLVPIEDRPAEAGDTAIVDFSGVLAQEGGEEEPQPIPGGSAEGFQLELEEGQFIPGFIDGIVGMELGETKEIAATFPEEYPQSDVAGKKALFTVTLKELKEKDLPDLDDDFAQDVSEFETLAELRESLTKRLTDEAEQKTKENKTLALFAKLLEAVEVDPPESLISQQVNWLVNQTATQLQQQGLDIKKVLTQDLLAQMRETARPDALTQLKQKLAVEELARRESIEVSQGDIDAKVNDVLAQYGDRNDVDMERLRQVLEEDLIQEKVAEWLVENNTLDLVPEGSLSQQKADTNESGTQNPSDADGSTEAEPSPTPVSEANTEADAEADAEANAEANAETEH